MYRFLPWVFLPYKVKPNQRQLLDQSEQTSSSLHSLRSLRDLDCTCVVHKTPVGDIPPSNPSPSWAFLKKRLLLTLFAWTQSSSSAMQMKAQSLQRTPGPLFDPDKPPRLDNPLTRPRSLPAAGSYSFILIIRQIPPHLSVVISQWDRRKSE